VAAVRLGVEEVHEAHRQLDVGTLVAVDGVRAPALEQAVHQIQFYASLMQVDTSSKSTIVIVKIYCIFDWSRLKTRQINISYRRTRYFSH
jgi:hypothetical protein